MDQKELENIRKEPKETRLEYYFRNCGEMEAEDLNLTEEDVRHYQLTKVSKVSMPPTEKRDILVKQMLKPLLKERGFKTSGCNWWKELEDSWLFIHMKNSQWNGVATGAVFGFQISVSGKDEIRDKLSNQWMYNQQFCLEQNDFLPYWGMLTPRMNIMGYQIDGFRNYLPLDEPTDKIMEQVRGDFENHILPELEQLRTKADWEKLYQEKSDAGNAMENRLLRYYSIAHTSSCSESNMSNLIDTQKRFELTPEEITSHFDWLEIIRQNSALPHLDAKDYILRSLEAQ